MPISERDQAILGALEAAGTHDPDLSTFYEFHRTLFELLAQARSDISATLEMVDEEALQARLLQGLPLLSFDQLPVEAGQFAELVSAVASVLAGYTPELADHTVRDGPAECLALAQQRFEEGKADDGQGEQDGGPTLAQLSVDLALKPYLEWAAEQALLHVDQTRWRQEYCPVCAGAPDLGFLEEEAGARYLICSRCSSQWLYHRFGCPFCGTHDHAKQSYYLGDDEVHRLYVCQACHRYLKVLDLRQVSRKVLFPAERVTTVAMDLAAQEEGYR